MHDPPNFPLLSQASEEALKMLYQFKMHNTLQVTPGVPSYSPSPKPALPTPHFAHYPPTDGVRLPAHPQNIPAALQVHPHDAHNAQYMKHEQQQQRDDRYLYPPTSHMPTLISKPTPSYPYVPKVYLEPLTCLTREMVFDRVYLLLSESLTERWTNNSNALIHISKSITDNIITSGRKGTFGPNGLSTLTDIFNCIGHRGTQFYICLAVRGAGGVHEFFTGEPCQDKGKDPMRDWGMMQRCREGFDQAVDKAYLE